MSFMIRELEFRGHPYKIYCTDQSPQHPSWYSFYDEVEVRRAKWGVGEGDLILDVGGAYGSYTLCGFAVGAAKAIVWSPPEMLTTGPDGRMLAEPDFLHKSLEANGWQDRCTILTNGVYDKTGWLDTETQEFWETAPDFPPGQGRPTVINVSALDDQLADLLSVNGSHHMLDALGSRRTCWMKLDVEGAEVHVLRGAEKTIATLRPFISVENHKFKLPTIEDDVRKLMTGWDYVEIETTPYHSVSHSLYVPQERK